jgi:hypothetical protein
VAAAQRKGKESLVVPVEMTPARSAKLARLEYLATSELENRRAIGTAIARLIDRIVLE